MENKINTNIILVDDYSINDLTGYIKSWMAEYKESLDKKFEIKIYEINVKRFALVVSQNISSPFFYYLINYLTCPNGDNLNYKVTGYHNGTEKNVLNKVYHQVYISHEDTEGDNVFCITANNENYKISFQGYVQPLEWGEKFISISELDWNRSDPKKVINYEQKDFKLQSNCIADENKIFKRGNIILGILLSCSIFSMVLLVSGVNIKFINNFFLWISILFTFWACADYKVFSKLKMVNKSLFISVFIFLVNIYILRKFQNSNLDYPIFLGHGPLIFIIGQIIIRNIYLKLVKKEPRVVGGGGTFSEMIYTTILMLVFLLGPTSTSKFIINFIHSIL